MFCSLFIQYLNLLNYENKEEFCPTKNILYKFLSLCHTFASFNPVAAVDVVDFALYCQCI